MRALDSDHSGKAAGKLLYDALKHYGIAGRLCQWHSDLSWKCESYSLSFFLVASTSDNASVNSVANAYHSKRVCKRTSDKVNATDMQVGCAAHVTNLICQAFLSSFGAAPNPDDEDLYEQVKGEELTYNPDNDPAIVEQAVIATEELHLHTAGKLSAFEEQPDSDSDSSAFEEESDDEAVSEDEVVASEEEGGGGTGSAAKHCKGKKELSVIDKVCSICSFSGYC